MIKLNDGIIDAQTRSSWSREAAIVPTWTTTISREREMEDGKEKAKESEVQLSRQLPLVMVWEKKKS